MNFYSAKIVTDYQLFDTILWTPDGLNMSGEVDLFPTK